MVAIWDTWCPWCRKFIADMVKIHEAYKDEMVVIALSDEPEETVAAPFWGNHRNTAAGVPPNIPAVKFNYYVAVDTQARMKKAMGVTGVPHVFIIEPEDGCVVWEGYPYDIGYELTLEKIDKILAVGREAKKAK